MFIKANMGRLYEIYNDNCIMRSRDLVYNYSLLNLHFYTILVKQVFSGKKRESCLRGAPLMWHKRVLKRRRGFIFEGTAGK